MEKKTRKISARMYGQRAFDILDSVHGRLSQDRGLAFPGGPGWTSTNG